MPEEQNNIETSEEPQDEKSNETEDAQEQPKVGVFVCHCGRNIAGVVGIEDLLNEIRSSDPELVVKDHMFVCSVEPIHVGDGEYPRTLFLGPP
jgi:hypothetical protein